MSYARVAILGVGLLGGSIGLALRQRGRCRVVGFGHRRATLDKALELGAIDQAAESLPDAVADAELVILCTPVGTFAALLEGIAPHLRPGTIVTDVGSTKRSVVELARKALPEGVPFVGSHPMAGSDKSGVAHARADLFEGALCILTPDAATPTAPLETVDAFWRSLGMHIRRLTPDQHDRLIAEVSHLPHVLSAALMSLPEASALELSGRGFADTTRIAGGDGALWRDILLDNRDQVKAALSRLRGELDQFEALLDPAQGDALRTWLDAAAARRRSLDE